MNARNHWPRFLGKPKTDGKYGETMREKRERWKAKGLCRDCGRKPERDGATKCDRCRAMRNHHKWRKQQGA